MVLKSKISKMNYLRWINNFSKFLPFGPIINIKTVLVELINESILKGKITILKFTMEKITST